MTTAKEELIATIYVNEANFEFIGKSKVINGTLHQEIKRIMDMHAKQKAWEAWRDGRELIGWDEASNSFNDWWKENNQ